MLLVRRCASVDHKTSESFGESSGVNRIPAGPCSSPHLKVPEGRVWLIDRGVCAGGGGLGRNPSVRGAEPPCPRSSGRGRPRRTPAEPDALPCPRGRTHAPPS